MTLAVQQYLQDLWAVPGARLVLWFAVFAVLIAIMVFIVQQWRGVAHGRQSQPLDNLTDFRQMHLDGTIDDQEYDRLRNVLRDPAKLPESTQANSGSPDKLGD